MGQSILPRLYCNGIGMYRGSVNPTQAWWLGGWYLYRYSRSLWFSSLGHQKMLKEHFQQLKMFLKNFTLSKIYNELATKANTNTNTDMQMQIQIQLQGGVVTFSGIYCQTATGAKRSAAPFIAVAPMLVVLVVSCLLSGPDALLILYRSKKEGGTRVAQILLMQTCWR